MEQTIQNFGVIFDRVRAMGPMVHSFANIVTANDCANVLLACGASPCMSYYIKEVEDISAQSDCLVLNMGLIGDLESASMIQASRVANQLGHPVVLDPVGAGASPYRNSINDELLKKVQFTSIRGNSSEIKSLAGIGNHTKGVDAGAEDVVTEKNLDQTIALLKDLSFRTGAVIGISGAIDLVGDSNRVYVIRNGHPMMAQVTGTGCMVTNVIAAFCAANKACPLEATAAAIAAYGLSGELAYRKTEQFGGGTSMFRMFLIDAMSQMNGDTLMDGMKVSVME